VEEVEEDRDGFVVWVDEECVTDEWVVEVRGVEWREVVEVFAAVRGVVVWWG
jgi:hypothetical protein